MTPNGERKHSKFSASGSERWLNCSASVALSEGIPSKDSVWSVEGTEAHGVLEAILEACIRLGRFYTPPGFLGVSYPREMTAHAVDAANFILRLWETTLNSEIKIESRIHLKFIHPEMFGTFDGAVIDHFGTLHVFDYKYGAGHAVSPKNNLQMIFYGLGLASLYQWNFKRVRLWIIQPRIKGYDGPTFWELGILELMQYIDVFKKGVEKVEINPEFKEGPHCHWCRAKNVCPLKNEKRSEKARQIFLNSPLK